MAQAGGIGDVGAGCFGDCFQAAIARAAVGRARMRI